MLTSGHHIVQSLVLPGRSTPIVPQGNSVSPYGYEQMKYHDQWTGHIVQCWVPPGQSLLSLCPRGTQHYQMAMKYYHQWTSYCSKSSGPREESTVIVPQGCSLSPVGYEISPVDWSLFNVESPWGSLLSLFRRETQYHHLALKYWRSQRSYSIVQCWVPLGKSQQSLRPRGTCYRQLAMKYYHQCTGHCLMLRAPREVNFQCAPGELSITSWPWKTISACHHQCTGHVVKCVTSRLWTIVTSE